MDDTPMLLDQPDNSISFASEAHAESDSDYESAAEVEGLPSLKPVAIMNKFLHDSDQVISSRFIDAAYPERNFTNINAPPELVGLITDLLPILPRRPDPIGDGADNTERILSRTRRLKALRKDTDAFANIALQFWTDIKTDRNASKHITVPGTATHLYLREVLENIKRFRRLIDSMVDLSLVKRSRKRAGTQCELGRAVHRLRALTRDARKRLGLAHKIQATASGPIPPARQPITTFLHPTELVNSAVRSAFVRFLNDAGSLYADFPNLCTLQPFFLFFRNITLEPHIVKHLPKVRASTGLNAEQEEARTSEAVEVNVLINKIHWECGFNRLEFKNVTSLNAWKATAGSRINRWAQHAFRGSSTFKRGKPIVTFQLMLITFCCAGYWKEAATVAELLVIAHRDFSQSEHESTKAQLNLCNAIGVLALCLLQCERPQEALLAIEDAMSLLQPLHTTKAERTVSTMFLLRITHSRALLDLSKKSANDAIRLYLIRKAHDSSCWGLPSLHKLHKLSGPALDTKLACKIEIAFALQARTEASHALRRIAAELQQQHGRAKLRVMPGGAKPTCCEVLTAEESHFVHKVVPGLVATGSPPSAGISVEVFRVLAEKQPVLYEPMLADALVWKAEHFTESDSHALANLREAETIYKRLTETFYNHFGKQLVHTYTLIASRCISSNRIGDAKAALAEGVRVQGLLVHKPNSVLWRGYDIAASLAAAHAGVLSQLGHHKEALEEATKAESAIRALHHNEYTYGQYLAEPILVKGISQLMLSEPKKALIQLNMAIHLLKVASRSSTTPCEAMPTFILALAWRGATRKALGRARGGQQEVEQALELLRALLQARGAEAQTSEHRVDAVEAMHPLLLTILAVFLLDTDPRQAIVKTHEALALVRTVKLRIVDPQTHKTAVQVQALALNALERPLEASDVAREAELLPLEGFLDKLQSERDFEQAVAVKVEENADEELAQEPLNEE